MLKYIWPRKSTSKIPPSLPEENLEVLWNYVINTTSSTDNDIHLKVSILSDPCVFDIAHDRFGIRMAVERNRITRLMSVKPEYVEKVLDSKIAKGTRGFSGGTGTDNYATMHFQAWATAELVTEYITKREFFSVMNSICRNSTRVTIHDSTQEDENGNHRLIFSCPN